MIVALFLGVDLAQTTNKVAIHSDSMWTLHVATSIVRECNTDLDEYRSQIEKSGFFGVDSVGGHLYGYFPIGPSLTVLPLIAFADGVSRLAHVDLAPILTGRNAARIESHIAAAIVALTTVVLYLTLRRAGFDAGIALISVLLFAFCTTVWSTASRALWQHGPSILALSIALRLLIQAHARPRTLAVLGLVLAWAWIIRPVNAISVVVITILAALRFKRSALYLFAGGIPLLAFCFFNYRLWHDPLPPYFHPSRLSVAHGTMLEALAGNLVSPGRGLFVFCPILLVAVYGIVVGLRNPLRRDLNVALTIAVLLHWVVISSFPHWWAGHSYGPRFFTDMMPYFAYFIAIAMAAFLRLEGNARAAAWAATAVLAVASFLIHFQGANSYPAHWWNADPANVDTHPERVWDWSDLQFLR